MTWNARNVWLKVIRISRTSAFISYSIRLREREKKEICSTKYENIRGSELLKTFIRNSFFSMGVVNLSALSDEQIGD